MLRKLGMHSILATLLLLPATAGAQTPHEGVERALGFAALRDNELEVRIWLGGVTRISTLYRIIKTANGASPQRFSWAEVVHAGKDGDTKAEATRETTINRPLMQKERCSGKVVETANYLELWKLPPHDETSCGSFIVVDGEVITIEMRARGRRHSVAYSNPDSCCHTVAGAIADHVRNVVRHID
jgi:hypothetical protein